MSSQRQHPQGMPTRTAHRALEAQIQRLKRM
jgi:hypothetical protein